MARQQKQVETEFQAAQKEMQRLKDSEAWEAAKTAADLAGVVDPTPTSDAISLGMSLAEGDIVGAGLSGLSMIPWLGDAVAKPIKAVRAAKSVKRIKEGMEVIARQINGMASKISRNKEAASRVRDMRRRAVQACGDCPEKWGTQLPTTGTWAGTKGSSKWTSADGKTEVPYKDGYPDFKNAKGPASTIGPPYKGKVEIEMKGNHTSDFTKARDAMRAETKNPYWPGNSATDSLARKKEPPGYTWHHGEDGASMHLVRSDVHGRSVADGQSGAAHTGGSSITQDPEF